MRERPLQNGGSPLLGLPSHWNGLFLTQRPRISRSEDVIARNVRSSLLEMAPPIVCRRIQDSEPIEIGEALGVEWFIAPVLLTARANRKCRNFLCRKPLSLMGGNEPHWPRSGCEPRLKRPGFWLADPVGWRGAYG